MYFQSFLTSAPDNCVGSALNIQLLYARRQRLLYPMWHSDHLNALEKRKPAPLSGTERRPSGLKACHLVTTVRYPDGGSILPSIKRPYISAILHGVNPRRRPFRSSCCHNLKTPPISMYHFCVQANAMSRIPILHSELHFALCCNEGHCTD